jgi:hypothetical protein
MSIVNFFETVEGTWFSQRTTHFEPGRPSQTGQTTLQIERVGSDHSSVTALCEEVTADAGNTAFALVIHQEGQASTYGSGSASPKRTTVLIGLKSDDEYSGQFFSKTEQEPAVAGHYQLEDEVLSLNIQNDEFESQERLWYMNPNLRMRTSLVKRADGLQMASFCSEIRRLSKQSS